MYHGFYKQAILLSEMANREHDDVIQFVHISKRRTLNLFKNSFSADEIYLKHSDLSVKVIFKRLKKFYMNLRSNFGFNWAIECFNSFILIRFIFKHFTPVYSSEMDANDIIEVNMTKIINEAYLDVISYLGDLLKINYGMDSYEIREFDKMYLSLRKRKWDPVYYCQKSSFLTSEYILLEIHELTTKTREFQVFIKRFEKILGTLFSIEIDYWNDYEDLLKTIKNEGRIIYEDKHMEDLFLDNCSDFLINVKTISKMYTDSHKEKDQFKEVLKYWKEFEASVVIFKKSILEMKNLGKKTSNEKPIQLKQKHEVISHSCIEILKVLRSKMLTVTVNLNACNKILHIFLDKKYEPLYLPRNEENKILKMFENMYKLLGKILPRLQLFIDDANAELNYNLELKGLMDDEINMKNRANIDRESIKIPFKIIHALKISNLIVFKPTQEVFKSSSGLIYITEEYFKCFIKKMVTLRRLLERNEIFMLDLDLYRYSSNDYKSYFIKEDFNSLFTSFYSNYLSYIPEERRKEIEKSVNNLRINKVNVLNTCDCFNVETLSGIMDCFKSKFDFDCWPVYENISLRTMLNISITLNGLVEKILELKIELMSFTFENGTDFGHYDIRDSLLYLNQLKSSASNSTESIIMIHRLIVLLSLTPDAFRKEDDAFISESVITTAHDIINESSFDLRKEFFYIIEGFIKTLSCFIGLVWILKPHGKNMQKILAYYMPRIYNPLQRISEGISSIMQVLEDSSRINDYMYYKEYNFNPIKINDSVDGIFNNDVRNRLDLFNDNLLDEADFIAKKVDNIMFLLDFEAQNFERVLNRISNFNKAKVKKLEQESSESRKIIVNIFERKCDYIEFLHISLASSIRELLDMYKPNNILSIFNYIERRVNYALEFVPKLSELQNSFNGLSSVLKERYPIKTDVTTSEYKVIFDEELHKLEFIGEKITFDLNEIIVIGLRNIKSTGQDENLDNSNELTYDWNQGCSTNNVKSPEDDCEMQDPIKTRYENPEDDDWNENESFNSFCHAMQRYSEKNDSDTNDSDKNDSDKNDSDKNDFYYFKLSDFIDKDSLSDGIREMELFQTTRILDFFNTLVGTHKMIKRIRPTMVDCMVTVNKIYNDINTYMSIEINPNYNRDRKLMESLISKTDTAMDKIREVNEVISSIDFTELCYQDNLNKEVNKCFDKFKSLSCDFLVVTEKFDNELREFFICMEFLDVKNPFVVQIFGEYFLQIKSDLEPLIIILEQVIEFKHFIQICALNKN